MFLITQEDLENLSEDPGERFVEIEQICRKRYQDIQGDSENWPFVKDCKIRYMSTVLSAAKYLNINPINRISLPGRSDFSDDDYNDFVSQIEFYSIQLMLEGSDRARKSSIVLEGTVRDRLVTLTAHLRDQVQKLDVPEETKNSLLKKIDNFEGELSRPRLTFVAVAVVSLAIAGAIADVGGATDIIKKLVFQIEETVGSAKEKQEDAAKKLLPHSEARRLLPPKEELKKNNNKNSKSYGLDDDIPF